MKKIEVRGTQQHSGYVFNGTCPHCGRVASFESIPNSVDLHINPNHILGHRRCPNRECNGYIFCGMIDNGTEFVTFPRQRIDFDKSSIPAKIVGHLEEAITTHAEGCFTASAMMIRRAIEEVCHDKEAKGEVLKDRIKALRDKVTLPERLFTGIDNLRLLGNDAAHVDAKDYDNIGKDETSIGIQLAKEILKSIYQLDDLVAKLEALKVKTP
jgi:hypothetical protein